MKLWNWVNILNMSFIKEICPLDKLRVKSNKNFKNPVQDIIETFPHKIKLTMIDQNVYGDSEQPLAGLESQEWMHQVGKI